MTGGQRNEEELKIAPTILDHITWEDPVMQEEIFGPILPVITFESLQEAATYDQGKTEAARTLLIYNK